MSSALIDYLSRELRMDERSVIKLINTAPERYKVYHIRKRTGGRREIAQPAVELKAAQRAIIKKYLIDLPVHPAATAYREGASIRANASAHARNGPILKFDFTDFFPSITEHAWLAYCEQRNLMDRADAIRSGRLLFRRPKGGHILRLSIGAPSSPILSNILMYAFDDEIHRRVSEHKVTYTRYADDMTFSAERTGYLTSVKPIMRSVLNQMKSPKLKLNDNKTVLVTRKYHRQVTGLVLTLDGTVSLGRTKKRLLRARIDWFKSGRLTKRQAVELAGHMAFAKDAEPEFYTRMERVYGKEVMDTLKLSVRGYKRPR